jgi:drug/metabolite transporter (DMT)-like permease
MNQRFQILSTNTLKAAFNGTILAIIGVLFFDLFSTTQVTYMMLIPGIIYAVSAVIYYSILKVKEISITMPLYQSLSILFVFISTVIIFQERVTWLNYLGIAGIGLGVYLVVSEQGLQLPRIDKASLLIFLLLPIDVISALVVKTLLFDIKPLPLAISMYLSAACLLFFLQVFSKKHHFPAFTELVPKLPKILCASFFGAMGTFFLFSALILGNASKVYPLAGLTSIFIFLLATFFLKEHFLWHRLLGTILAFAGIYFISL